MANALVAHQGAITATKAVALPAAISSGILDLWVSFVSQGQDPDDKKRALRVYGEAVAGFDPAIAEFAINWLKLHNPRNPYRPTAQDVHEHCRRLERSWRNAVEKFLKGEPWRCITQGMGMNLIEAAVYDGPLPLQPGCMIPDRLAKAYGVERKTA